MWKEYTKALKFPESYISMGLGFVVVVVAGLLIYNFITRGRVAPKLNQQQAVNQRQQLQPQAQPVFPLPAVYKVVGGDTLWSIAEKYYKSGYNWVTIAKENKLSAPNTIEVGQELKIPSAQPILVSQGQVSQVSIERILGDTYTVSKSDDLWDIAVRAYGDGYAWIKIAEANKLAQPNIIHAGNVLKIPR